MAMGGRWTAVGKRKNRDAKTRCRREGLVVPREKENMELTDVKAKRRRENNECGEKCTREDGRRDSKTEWRKKRRRYKKVYSSVLCNRKGTTTQKCNGERWRSKEITNRGKTPTQKTDNNTGMIEAELQKERGTSKDKTRSD